MAILYYELHNSYNISVCYVEGEHARAADRTHWLRKSRWGFVTLQLYSVTVKSPCTATSALKSFCTLPQPPNRIIDPQR